MNCCCYLETVLEIEIGKGNNILMCNCKEL